ncbi:hypothetical protein Tco_0779102 [Tanacetum coccineum]
MKKMRKLWRHIKNMYKPVEALETALERSPPKLEMKNARYPIFYRNTKACSTSSPKSYELVQLHTQDLSWTQSAEFAAQEGGSATTLVACRTLAD